VLSVQKRNFQNDPELRAKSICEGNS